MQAYNRSFREGAVLWRITDQPGIPLIYRFKERRPRDVIATAVTWGLLETSHDLGNLLTSWSKPWGSEQKLIFPEQGCDFEALRGLTKAWAFMGGLRPLDDLLSVPHVPECISMHRDMFLDLGLNTVRHVAVDFYTDDVILYFRAAGPLTEDQALSFVALAGYTSLSKSELMEMQKYLSPLGFTFAATITVPSGEIVRVAFYVLGLDEVKFPDIGHRMTSFSSEAMDHDAEDFTAVAWSYGVGGGKSMKAERSCGGQVVELMRGGRSDLAGEHEVEEGVVKCRSVTCGICYPAKGSSL